MDATVLAHIGHHWSSIVYVIPFVLFFWLVLRERARARRSGAAGEGTDAAPEPR